ncbi:hypothetical protein ACLOJK_015984 [Asimina triloba]
MRESGSHLILSSAAEGWQRIGGVLFIVFCLFGIIQCKTHIPNYPDINGLSDTLKRLNCPTSPSYENAGQAAPSTPIHALFLSQACQIPLWISVKVLPLSLYFAVEALSLYFAVEALVHE